MDIEKQIRVLVKEEVDKQLRKVWEQLDKHRVEILEQLSSISTSVDEGEEEQGEKLNILLRMRKHTLNELMSEYERVKAGLLEKKEPEETTDI